MLISNMALSGRCNALHWMIVNEAGALRSTILLMVFQYDHFQFSFAFQSIVYFLSFSLSSSSSICISTISSASLAMCDIVKVPIVSHEDI